MASSRLLNLVAIGFLLTVVAIVFWQIETDMKNQGIASGGPYDDAASFPRTIAILVGILLVVQFVIELFKWQVESPAVEPVTSSDLLRAGLMIAAFAVYLFGLTTVGYHLATAPLIFIIMWLCGMRQYLKMTVASFAIATGFAFVFEVFLNVVLPLGIWNIYIPW